MSRIRIFVAVLIVLPALALRSESPATTQQNQPQKKDRFSDPLPRCAVARLGTVRFRIQSSYGSQICLPKDGATYRVGMNEYDLATGKIMPALPLPMFTDDGKWFGGFTPGGEHAIYTFEKNGSAGLELVETTTGKLIRKFDEAIKSNMSKHAYVSPGMRFVALRSGDYNGANGFAVWEVASGKKTIVHLKPPRVPVNTTWQIGGVGFSPDGSRVAASNSDGTITVFDSATGETLKTCVTKITGLQAVAMIDAKTVWVGSRDAMLIWNIDEPEVKTIGGVFYNTYEIVPAPDRKHVVAATWHGLAVFDASGKMLTGPAKVGEADVVMSAAFMPDGKKLVITRGNVVEFYNTTDWTQIDKTDGHTVTVEHASVSADGNRIATIDAGGQLRVWDSQGKSLAAAKLERHGASPIAISPDGKSVALPSGMLDVETGAVKPRQGDDGVVAIHYVGGGKQIMEVAPQGIMWRDAATGKIDRTEKFAERFIKVAEMSADGTTLAYIDTPESHNFESDHGPRIEPVVHIFDLVKGKEVTKFSISNYRIAISPDGSRLATVDQGAGDSPFEAQLTIRETATGNELHVFKAKENFASMFAWSPDGKKLAVEFRDGVVQIFSAGDFKKLGEFTGHDSYIQDLRWLPDSQRIVTVSHDTTGLIWDTAKLPKIEKAQQR